MKEQKYKQTSMSKPYNLLGKSWDSSSRTLLDDHATLEENRILKTKLQKFEAEYNDPRRWYGIDPGDKRQWAEDEIYKIQVEYYSRCHGKRDEYLQELAKIKARHESRYKDDAASAVRFKRHEIDCSLMDKGDLQKILNTASMLSDPADKWNTDPDRVRAAAAELQKRGEKLGDTAKKAIQNIHGDARYLCEPGAEELKDLAEFYNTEFGQVRFHKSETCQEGKDGFHLAADLTDIIN